MALPWTLHTLRKAPQLPRRFLQRRARSNLRRSAMILDMDGVLYKNAAVEGRIVQRLEEETRHLGLAPTACQRLYEDYGATLRGLINEGHLKDDAIDGFYRKVYDSVDVSALQPDPLLRMQLNQLKKGGVEFWLATNSPQHFVARVLKALELTDDFQVVCPSQSNGWLNKPDPRYFDQLPLGRFFDDSRQHCAAWNDVRSDAPAYHVERETDVMTLVADALEVVPRAWRLQKAPYLQAKELDDLKSLNQDVLRRLRQELAAFQGEEIRVLDLGCGFLSMLPVLLEQLVPAGARLRYLGVDRDEELLTAAEARLETMTTAVPELKVELKCEDAVTAVKNAAPQTLVMGCSILDLIDVKALALALRQSQAGALLYFPIHYAGTTSFKGPLASVAEALSSRYNESLETRGQVRNVTALYSLLGEELALGASDWHLRGENLLLKQLISFMATNALGFQPLQTLREAVKALRSPLDSNQLLPSVQLHVTNVDYLGRVPKTGAVLSATSQGTKATRLAVEFTAPGIAGTVREAMPRPGNGEVLVATTMSGISAGTERRMLLTGCEEGEPLDSTLTELQGSAWPLRYGYCLVGTLETGFSSPSLPVGSRVFCFHPHASHAVVSKDSLQIIPDDIPDEDAIFFANMETACALCQDAAPVLGERVAVYGAGVVGALTAALLAPRFEVTVFDPNARRLAPLRRFGVSGGGGATGFDVVLELSGAGEALNQAIRSTRRGGKVVVGSLYGREEVSLPLGLSFHRSELTLLASQVSFVRAPLSTRWSKHRRAELTWQMLRQLRPKEWMDLRKVPVTQAPELRRRRLASKVATLRFAPSGSKKSSRHPNIFPYIQPFNSNPGVAADACDVTVFPMSVQPQAVPWYTLSVIREATVLPPEQRSSEQIDVILSFVQDVAFFAELPQPQRRHLCQVISLETFPSKSKIFNMGDHGDKYYIILTGAVSVQTLVPTLGEDGEEEHMEMETVAHLKEGHGFGELALQDSTLRQATVTTTDYTEFLITTRDHYQQFASAEHRKFVAARARFLRQCPRMMRAIQASEATEQEVKVMAQCLREKSLRGQDLLCKQGEPVEFMVLVRSGFLMKLHAVEVDRDRTEPSPNSSKLPSGTSRATVSPSRATAATDVSATTSRSSPPGLKLLHHGSLPAFSLYGCWELAEESNWPFSLVAECTAEIYIIQKQDMMRTIAKKLLAALIEISQEMQYSDAWLLQMNRQTERWDAYKHDIALRVNGDRQDAEERLGLKESAFKVPSVVLTEREEEFYSDSPAQQLRRLKALRKDKHLQKMLHRAAVPGYANLTQVTHNGATYLTLGDFSTKIYAKPREDWDPSIFFVKHWSAISSDKSSSLAIDLSSDVAESPGSSPASSPRGTRRRSLGALDMAEVGPGPGAPSRRKNRHLRPPRPPVQRPQAPPMPRRKVWVRRSRSPPPPLVSPGDLQSCARAVSRLEPLR
eukprot:s116_g6.t1